MLSSIKPSAISLFTGAGGLDIGFERAGFRIISGIEINKKYFQTLLINKQKEISISEGESFHLEKTILINDDIRAVELEKLNPDNQVVDCIIGGPPCQSFSSAGKQKTIFDPRGALIYEFVRTIQYFMPKTFLLENVRGLVTARGKNNEPGEILHDLLKKFQEVGYSCRVGLLNSADYGSFQRRVRCFIIGTRISNAPTFPMPTHSKNPVLSFIPEYQQHKWKTLADFLEIHMDNDRSNWIYPTPELYDQLRNITDGSGLKSVGRVEATRPSGHWGYRQGTFISDLTLPARTVTGSSSQDWIRLKDGTLRRLTLKEVALLQGFPKEWEFYGSKADAYQQIGNAVPTVFGELIGNALYKHLFDDKVNSSLKSDIIPIPLPSDIIEAIRYTKYDSARNREYRAYTLRAVDGE